MRWMAPRAWFLVACFLTAGCSETGGVPEVAGPTDAGPPAPLCESTDGPGARVPLRRLNAQHIERTVARVLRTAPPLLVADETLYTYRSNVSSAVDVATARGYLDFAELAAQDADFSRCTREGCLAWLLDEVGLELFRRPLDATTRARYTELFMEGGATGGHRIGARWVLEAMLQSPAFLYVEQAVDEAGYLDDYSMATRLALTLWGAGPDRPLLEAAGRGELSTAEDVRRAAEAMLADPRSHDGFRDFVDQWLSLAKLDDPAARPDLAALGRDVVDALRDEPVAFFRQLLLSDGDLDAMLTAHETASAPELAAIYGGDILANEAGVSSLDPSRRAGILSLPGVQAALAHAGSTSPTLRGRAVLANFLCTPPGNPPAGISLTLPPPMPGATTRQRLEAHFSSAVCATCHQKMDGIGFAFESFDWFGRSRDTEDGRPIDDVGALRINGGEVAVDGPIALAQALARRSEIAVCLSRQWTRYATGIPESSDAECLIDSMSRTVEAPSGLREMVLEQVTSDWYRRGGVR